MSDTPGYPWVTWATYTQSGSIQRIGKMHYERTGGETACGRFVPNRHEGDGQVGSYRNFVPNIEASGKCRTCESVVNRMAQMGAADGRP